MDDHSPHQRTADSRPEPAESAAGTVIDRPQAARLDRIRATFAQLKTVEAECGFGVLLADGTPLEPIPGIPEAAFEVFRIVGGIEGSNFRFEPPPELGSAAVFQANPHDPHDPMGPNLPIGCELHSVPRWLRGEIRGEGIYLDLTDGDVYHFDPDEYVFCYEHPDEDLEIHIFAPDIVTFFDEFVLGPRYLELVDTVLWPGAREHRVRKGRFRGQYEDTWLRLLVTAGVVDGQEGPLPGQKATRRDPS
ncbi:hypothetical protein GCM10027280_08430 [Micromonospora polyrhachis]|uniref:Uncharacterized protein n=1 Tax=Micromonospora polyrhachis TaxID=1282883 RepID=A0A7W7SNZ0_9ACTN|nr:hypothetical protein [Micromonospora polyrhachis]MBB4958297.1 hypothetical protein [Micromonospora polyrhachis]